MANTLCINSDQEYLEHGRVGLSKLPEPLRSLPRRGTMSLRHEAAGANTPW